MEELQKIMETHVGIVREEKELLEGLQKLEALKPKIKNVKATGDKIYNPGWHCCVDLQNMIAVSEAITRGAIERKESRGGHTRLDHPASSPEFGKINIVISKKGGEMKVNKQPLPKMPEELQVLINNSSSSS